MWWQQVALNAIAFHLGAVSVHWYGVVITIAVLAAYWLARRLYSRVGSVTVIDDLVFWIILSGLLGARLFHVFVFEWSYYGSHLAEIPAIWNGGIAIQGAISGGLVALIMYCRLKKIAIWPLLDCIAPALALGQAIGRWGNYFNQELYGQPTSSWLGIYISPELRVTNYESFSTFHPAFLYESILMLGISYLLFVIWKKTRPNLNGRVFALYLIAYGVIRFGMDFIRLDPEIIWLGLKLSQYLSLVLIVAGVSLFIWKQKKTT